MFLLIQSERQNCGAVDQVLRAIYTRESQEGSFSVSCAPRLPDTDPGALYSGRAAASLGHMHRVSLALMLGIWDEEAEARTKCPSLPRSP